VRQAGTGEPAFVHDCVDVREALLERRLDPLLPGLGDQL